MFFLGSSLTAIAIPMQLGQILFEPEYYLLSFHFIFMFLLDLQNKMVCDSTVYIFIAFHQFIM